MSRKHKANWIMNILFSLSLQSLVLASGPNPSTSQDPQNPREALYLPDQRAKVTVLVHNYAHLLAQILIEAQDRASLIFRKAGVEIEWADCSLNDEDPSLYPKCPAVLDPTQLLLRIFPKTVAKTDISGEAWLLVLQMSFGIASRNTPKD